MTINDKSVALSFVWAIAIVWVVAVATNDRVTVCCVAWSSWSCAWETCIPSLNKTNLAVLGVVAAQLIAPRTPGLFVIAPLKEIKYVVPTVKQLSLCWKDSPKGAQPPCPPLPFLLIP